MKEVGRAFPFSVISALPNRETYLPKQDKTG
jgi:hypothetical protein